VVETAKNLFLPRRFKLVSGSNQLLLFAVLFFFFLLFFVLQKPVKRVQCFPVADFKKNYS